MRIRAPKPQLGFALTERLLLPTRKLFGHSLPKRCQKLLVYKSRGSAFDPFTCAWAVRDSRHGDAQTRHEREAEEKPKPQDK